MVLILMSCVSGRRDNNCDSWAMNKILYEGAGLVYTAQRHNRMWIKPRRFRMDINKTLQELKARPGFTEHVGMMLVHNGVVRGWSRNDRSPVTSVHITPDREKMAAIVHEMEQRPGIFAIVAHAEEGLLKPSDDVLFLVVAGDIRENVKATFAELLDRIKAEAVIKLENFEA